MKKAIGLLEFKSIGKGIEIADEVLKSSNVTLVMSTPICPGKYIVIITGDVGAVTNGVKVGKNLGGIYLIEASVIANIHSDVFPALGGTIEVEKVPNLGIIETMSAVSSIQMADRCVKAANVNLIEVRIARGLGGKGYVLFSGEISAVKNAVKSCEESFGLSGEMLYGSVIPNPEKDLIEKLL